MGTYKDKYRLDKTSLGKGGMAEVFRATRRGTEETYALKRATRGPGHEERLRREIEVLLRLEHRNIMPVLDCDEERTWYCMPIARGSLHDLGPELFDNEKLKVIEDIARGLDHAHDHEVVHRDVTPNNILALSERGEQRWVIGDFGLVRRPPGQTTSVLTRAGMGTAWFAAPEVLVDAHMADRRADVYSFGKTIEWMVTGRMSDDGRDGIPEPWDELVRKMTAVSRDERLESMAHVVEAIAGLEKALRRQQRAWWGGNVAPPRNDGLPEEEKILLQAIANDASEEWSSFAWINNRCMRLTTMGVRLALKRLVDDGLVERRMDPGDPDDPEILYALSDKGLSWLQANRHQLNLTVVLDEDNSSR